VSFDALVVTAHPDDAETQMGGTLAKLADRGQRILLVDLTTGEPPDFGLAVSAPGRLLSPPGSWASSGSR
jgi:LmbE family N-acetylglucosaminyl deacetylase